MLGVGIEYEMTIRLGAPHAQEGAGVTSQRRREARVEVIIAGAGWAAHLRAWLASRPSAVIGVPIDSSALKGIGALLSTVRCAGGVPWPTMSSEAGAKNAPGFSRRRSSHRRM